eukprot:624874-Rhodomonas_salina.1
MTAMTSPAVLCRTITYAPTPGIRPARQNTLGQTRTATQVKTEQQPQKLRSRVELPDQLSQDRIELKQHEPGQD